MPILDKLLEMFNNDILAVAMETAVKSGRVFIVFFGSTTIVLKYENHGHTETHVLFKIMSNKN